MLGGQQNIILVLLLALVSNACLLRFHSAPQSSEAEFEQLRKHYALAFENSALIDIAALHALEAKTSQLLQRNLFSGEQLTTVRRWQHKLHSYLAWLSLAQPINEYGLLKQDMLTLFVNQMRNTSVQHIEFDPAAAKFFQQVQAGRINAYDVSVAEKQVFFQALRQAVMAATANSVKTYQRMFAFEPTGWQQLCRKQDASHCERLDSRAADKGHVYADARAVADAVNKIIVKLNELRLDLKNTNTVDNWGIFDEVADELIDVREEIRWKIFQEIDFESEKVVYLFQQYESVLLTAAQEGILPLFLTQIFQKRSGNLFLKRKTFIKDITNQLLTEVTAATAQLAIVEMKKNIMQRWVELQKLQYQVKLVSDAKLYEWIINNEVIAARLMVQQPRFIPAVVDIVSELQQRQRDTLFKRAVRGVLLTVGVASVLVTLSSRLLSAAGLFAASIVVGDVINFGEVTVGVFDSMALHNRYLMLEQSLISGTSLRIGDGLELLREFHTARKKAIFSGAIGVPLNIGALLYIARRIGTKERIFFIEVLAGYFSNQHRISGVSDQEFFDY